MSSVLDKICGRKYCVDETTDARDCSVLNIVMGVEKRYFLIDVVFMDRCNYSTFSQAILASINRNNLGPDDAWAVVTDNAAYCLKAYREVLRGVLPNSVHVTCLCHVINLKPARKRRCVDVLIIKGFLQAKAPPEAVCTRWNSWFDAVKYHAEHHHLYREFLMKEQSTSMAVTNILSQVEMDEKVWALTRKLTFISEGCSKLMMALTILEVTHRPTAVSSYNADKGV